jgi:hypothetical protein
VFTKLYPGSTVATLRTGNESVDDGTAVTLAERLITAINGLFSPPTRSNVVPDHRSTADSPLRIALVVCPANPPAQLSVTILVLATGNRKVTTSPAVNPLAVIVTV